LDCRHAEHNLLVTEIYRAKFNTDTLLMTVHFRTASQLMCDESLRDVTVLKGMIVLRGVTVVRGVTVLKGVTVVQV